MIKIDNLKEINESLGNTFGYISIGMVKVEISNELDYFTYSMKYGFKAECKCDNESFDLLILKVAIKDSSFLVLGDLSKISEIALINDEEILEAVKEVLKDEVNKTTCDFIGEQYQYVNTNKTNNYFWAVDYNFKNNFYSNIQQHGITTIKADYSNCKYNIRPSCYDADSFIP